MAGAHPTLGLATSFLSTFLRPVTRCKSAYGCMERWTLDPKIGVSGEISCKCALERPCVRTPLRSQISNKFGMSLHAPCPLASFSELLLFFGPSFVSSGETRKTV